MFPGGRPHVGLYVPGGNLVFALVPGGLRSGFVGRAFGPGAAETGAGQDFCVYKRKP